MKTASKAILVALILSLPLLAIAQPGPHGTKGKMMEQLDLTDEQQSQIQELRLEHQKEMMTLNDEMHSLRNQMKLVLTEDKPSNSEIETLAGKIGTASRNIALAKANHRLDVRKLLTDEQKVKFDILTLTRNKHMGRRGPSPDGPRPIPGCCPPMDRGPREDCQPRRAR